MLEHNFYINRFVIATFAALFLCVLNYKTVFATDIEIVGNGDKSVSSTEVSSQTSQAVVSSNEVGITNNVNSESNSGNNTANSNSGNTNVTTGSSNNNTEIQNSGNTSVVDNKPCCSASTSVNISNNGSGSVNTANTVDTHQTTVSVENKATILNSVITKADTGNNQANENLGSVNISTGQVNIKTNISNTSINSTLVISGNGSQTINSVSTHNSSNISIYTSNSANILNNLVINGNSGGNTALKNLGNVYIKTGNVNISTSLVNSNINSSVVKALSCCNSSTPTDPGDQSHNPVIIPSSSSGSSVTSSNGNSGGGSAQVLAASIGSILPATGSNIALWAGVFNVFMLLMGLYLRNHSGRAPCLLIVEFSW